MAREVNVSCRQFGCSCCREAYFEGLKDGVAIGFRVGRAIGYANGYIDGTVDAVRSMSLLPDPVALPSVHSLPAFDPLKAFREAEEKRQRQADERALWMAQVRKAAEPSRICGRCGFFHCCCPE